MRAEHTILVIDDHEPNLYVATRLLERAGYKVLQGSTGSDAVFLAERASAVLMDVNLPDMNGVAVCELLKRTSKKPVVLMSAVFVDDLHEGAALQAGADLYLLSPVSGEQLTAGFDKLLGVSIT